MAEADHHWMDSMKLEQLLQADKETQLSWLVSRGELRGGLRLESRAYDEPLGSYFFMDNDRLADMLAYPESYDLGWALQNRIAGISDARAIAINDGATLNELEIEAAKYIVREEQVEHLDGFFCSGFFEPWDGTTTIFAAYQGPSLGQGGIHYEFERLFRTKKDAKMYFKSLGGHWEDFGRGSDLNFVVQTT